MRATVSVRRVPKAGNRPEEDEDAAYPATSGDWTGRLLRCAVADGASEALLSRPWAELLARLYGEWVGATVEPAALLARAAARWRGWLRAYVRRRQRQGRPIQWYEEPGLEAGAFAALVGLTLHPPADGGTGAWTALGVGDSCLFQVRDAALLVSFPASDPADLGVRPLLIGSNPTRNRRLSEGVHELDGLWRAGDDFYLMTDALAHWCLGEHQAGRTPWPTLAALTTAAAAEPFRQWVAERRARRDLRNDDVTLMRIAVARETMAGCPGPS